MRAPSALFLAFVAAGCAAPAPHVAPRPAASPYAPPPPPPAVAPATDWRDRPVGAGGWRYTQDARGSGAMFGQAGADALAVLRCDRAAGRVFLSVASGADALTVRTSSVARTLPPAPPGGTPYLAATLAPGDPLLDAMAFSRGRFAVSAAGVAPVVLPADAEVGRVVEDCRG